MEILKEYFDYAILITLALMGFIAVWAIFERLIYLNFVKIDEFDKEEILEIALTKNLTTLYIIYSNAPYVGLLGTVVGVMITFYDIGMSGGMDAKSVMVGMSLALKATALGLCVAIPSLVAYNSLNRKIEILLANFRLKFDTPKR